ncbi:MAG: DUF5691 domain-containing protein [Bacteroidota bacterium]
MIWQEIVKAALIGTDRTQVSDSLKRTAESLGIDSELPPEKLLLQTAALLGQMQKAGSPAIQWTAPLPEPSAITAANVCSPKAARMLSRVLDGEYENLLPEFIQNLIDRQLFLPPEILPGIFQRALDHKELAGSLPQIIGKRGHWLARLNPAWRVFSPQLPPEAWSEGLMEERIAFLRKLRQQQPAEARALLEESWEQEGQKERLRFLKVMEEELGPEDEAFLESCLDNRRKDLRKACAKLLARIPGSALVERMTQRLGALMEVQSRLLKKDKLQIQLPEACDASMVRDGIDPRKQWAKGGVKASRFLQMMSLVPPTHWETSLQQSPDQLIALFVRSEWSTLLVQSILDATCLHKDRHWMKALLDFWLANFHKARWEELDLGPMLNVLPKDLYNEVLIEQLKDSVEYVEADSPIAQLLRLDKHPWEDRLSMLFVKNLKQWIIGEQSRSWGQWHLRELLKNAAFRTRPTLYDYFDKKWPRHDPVWSSWLDEVDDFLQVLRFRKRMLTVLDKPES